MTDRYLIIPWRDMCDPIAKELAKHMRIVVVPDDALQGPVSAVVTTIYDPPKKLKCDSKRKNTSTRSI